MGTIPILIFENGIIPILIFENGDTPDFDFETGIVPIFFGDHPEIAFDRKNTWFRKEGTCRNYQNES